MTTIRNVCVYCASSSEVDVAYKEGAARLGRLIAAQGWGLVYGGGAHGLMGITSKAAVEAGASAIGIIPEHLQQKEGLPDWVQELHVVETMHVRKQMMVDRSDAFIIMPGGCGTLDEMFEIFTWRQLQLHDKPILLVNLEGYWAPLIEMLDRMADQRFMKPEHRKMVLVVNSVEEIPSILSGAPEARFESDTTLA